MCNNRKVENKIFVPGRDVSRLVPVQECSKIIFSAEYPFVI